MRRTSLGFRCAFALLCLLPAVSSCSTRPAAGGKPAASKVGRIERLDPRFDALVPPGAELDKVADGLEWAEGPVWDSKSSALLFSDVPRNRILRWKEGFGVTEFLRPSGYSGTAPFTGREPG